MYLDKKSEICKIKLCRNIPIPISCKNKECFYDGYGSDICVVGMYLRYLLFDFDKCEGHTEMPTNIWF